MDDERTRRSGWLWLLIALFVIAVLVIILWAWPAREPPASRHDVVIPTRVQASGSVPTTPTQTVIVSSTSAVPAARFDRS
jgi:hypothetical protein